MYRVRFAVLALVALTLPLAGCKKDTVAKVHHPATLEESGQKGIMKVRLEPRAAENGSSSAPAAAAVERKRRRVSIDSSF